MGRVFRLVQKPTPSLPARLAHGYRMLLIGLLVIIAGCLVLTLALTFLGL